MSAKSSKKALKKFLKQMPSHDDVIDMLGQLKSEDNHAADRAVAIVGAALLEHGLKIIILSEFIELDDDTETRELFDLENGGQLGTLGARIRMSYAMGLIGSTARDDLNLVNKIRNGFAHSALKLDFGLTEFSNMCGELMLIGKDDTRNAKDTYIETIAYISEAFQKKISSDIDITFMTPSGFVVSTSKSNRPRRFLP